LIHDDYDVHNVEMVVVVDIDHDVDVEMMMAEVVHKDQLVLHIVYLMLVMIDHVAVELVERVFELDD
jgi:hypothetical protein